MPLVFSAFQHSLQFTSVFRVASIAVVTSLCLLAQVCSSEKLTDKASRSQVVRIAATSDADVKFIRNLRHRFNLDALREMDRANATGDFLFPSHLAHVMRRFLTLHGIPFTVLIEDTDGFFSKHETQEELQRLKRSVTEDAYRYKFLSYNQINSFLARVQYKATNANVHIGFIGHSFEGRETPYVKITSKRSLAPKSIIFIDGGIHSREWISPAMALEIIHRLAFNTEQDPQVDQLLEIFDFIVVPLVNPDGYAYTFSPDTQSDYVPTRLWRKSRTSKYDQSCYGVDINRNFGFKWSNNPNYGGSSDPCSPSFSGPYSFSEPESQNLRQLLLDNKDAIKGYLSFHSYGQYMLYPWGFREDAEIEDEEDLLHVARAFKDIMRRKNYHYHVGGSAKSLYPAAGGSSDYVKGVIGVKYSYTLELPPVEGEMPWGFIIPETRIKPIVTDTWRGIVALLFRLNNNSKNRTEKLQAIEDEMKKRLISINDTNGSKNNFKINLPESKTVSIMNDQRLPDILNVLGFELTADENMTDMTPIDSHANSKNRVNKQVIWNSSPPHIGSHLNAMRSSGPKLWSLGDTLRYQYKYFNSNFRN